MVLVRDDLSSTPQRYWREFVILTRSPLFSHSNRHRKPGENHLSTPLINELNLMQTVTQPNHPCSSSNGLLVHPTNDQERVPNTGIPPSANRRVPKKLKLAYAGDWVVQWNDWPEPKEKVLVLKSGQEMLV